MLFLMMVGKGLATQMTFAQRFEKGKHPMRISLVQTHQVEHSQHKAQGPKQVEEHRDMSGFSILYLQDLL